MPSINHPHAPVGPVLAGVDGGAGTTEVVRAASRLASIGGAELVVAHIVAVPMSIFPEVAALAMITEDDAIAEMVPDIWISLIDSDVRWRVMSSTGVPATKLLQLANNLKPSAIVVGADTAGWTARLRRGLSGSVPGRLLRHQDVPVVVIPAACSHRRQPKSGDRPPTVETTY